MSADAKSEGAEMTYDDLAILIGYKMITIIGIMGRLGLTTLPYYVKDYVDPSNTNDPALRDFERWLKWALSAKNSEERKHLYPEEFVNICQATLPIESIFEKWLAGDYEKKEG